MAKIQIDTLVVVRRVVMELDDRPAPSRPHEVIRRSASFFPDGIGAPPSGSIAEKPRHNLRSVAAGALLTLAAVALGDLTRRRSNLPALSVGSAVKVLPSSARRSLRPLPAGLSHPEQ